MDLIISLVWSVLPSSINIISCLYVELFFAITSLILSIVTFITSASLKHGITHEIKAFFPRLEVSKNEMQYITK